MITQPADIYKRLAEKYNLPVETIRNAVNYFWLDGVKRSMETLINSEIYINRLGSFEIKAYKVDKVIGTLREQLARPDVPENLQEHRQLLLDNLIRIKEDLEKIKNAKKDFNELYKQDSRDIQEQAPDMGGVEEQINKEGTC